MLMLITSKRFLHKKYNQLFDMAYAENFILVNLLSSNLFFFLVIYLVRLYRFSFHMLFIQPIGEVGETKSMHKEVVLGGDVWDLLDELMIYMGNPMQYYERGVKFVRVSFSFLFFLFFFPFPCDSKKQEVFWSFENVK